MQALATGQRDRYSVATNIYFAPLFEGGRGPTKSMPHMSNRLSTTIGLAVFHVINGRIVHSRPPVHGSQACQCRLLSEVPRALMGFHQYSFSLFKFSRYSSTFTTSAGSAPSDKVMNISSNFFSNLSYTSIKKLCCRDSSSATALSLPAHAPATWR